MRGRTTRGDLNGGNEFEKCLGFWYSLCMMSERRTRHPFSCAPMGTHVCAGLGHVARTDVRAGVSGGHVRTWNGHDWMSGRTWRPAILGRKWGLDVRKSVRTSGGHCVYVDKIKVYIDFGSRGVGGACPDMSAVRTGVVELESGSAGRRAFGESAKQDSWRAGEVANGSGQQGANGPSTGHGFLYCSAK